MSDLVMYGIMILFGIAVIVTAIVLGMPKNKVGGGAGGGTTYGAVYGGGGGKMQCPSNVLCTYGCCSDGQGGVYCQGHDHRCN